MARIELGEDLLSTELVSRGLDPTKVERITSGKRNYGNATSKHSVTNVTQRMNREGIESVETIIFTPKDRKTPMVHFLVDTIVLNERGKRIAETKGQKESVGLAPIQEGLLVIETSDTPYVDPDEDLLDELQESASAAAASSSRKPKGKTKKAK